RQAPGLTIAAARPDDFPVIRELLAANGLPVADLVDPIGTFLIAGGEGAIAGVVGLETHGRTALLRSLCVPAERRRQGVARLLCAAVESMARGLQASELCLLTTTARAFFERQGFIVAPRESATPVLRASSEFRDLCPSSA